MSWLTPPSAALVTPGEIPAAEASADMLWTKEWKSPPQRAAWEGVVRRKAARNTAARYLSMLVFPISSSPQPDDGGPKMKASNHRFYGQVPHPLLFSPEIRV